MLDNERKDHCASAPENSPAVSNLVKAAQDRPRRSDEGPLKSRPLSEAEESFRAIPTRVLEVQRLQTVQLLMPIKQVGSFRSNDTQRPHTLTPFNYTDQAY